MMMMVVVMMVGGLVYDICCCLISIFELIIQIERQLKLDQKFRCLGVRKLEKKLKN